MQRISSDLPAPHLHTYMKHRTHNGKLLWPHGPSGGRTCTSVLSEIEYEWKYIQVLFVGILLCVEISTRSRVDLSSTQDASG